MQLCENSLARYFLGGLTAHRRGPSDANETLLTGHPLNDENAVFHSTIRTDQFFSSGVLQLKDFGMLQRFVFENAGKPNRNTLGGIH